MEIQEGKGPWASHVSGIVPIGSTLTLVVAITDPSGEFDMMVRSCVAHDGTKPPLQLTDDRGCVLRPKMFSNFQKARTKDGRASVITYAHFSAFKFPDTMQVNIQCKVVICRHGCPKACSSETIQDMGIAHRIGLPQSPIMPKSGNPVEIPAETNRDFQKRIDLDLSVPATPTPAAYTGQAAGERKDSPDTRSYFPANQKTDTPSFPYGPRSYGGSKGGPRKSRNVHDDKELRVSNSYQAISRTDLAFAPNVTSDSVSVYAGRHSNSAQYGVCLSVPSFGALFASLGMFTVTAVLVAVVCGYHYRNYSKNQIAMPISHNLHHFQKTSQDHKSRTVIQLTTLSRTKVH